MTAAAELFDRRVAPGRALGADAELVALACHDMARRFAGGGKLVVFGSGAAATDAQHLADGDSAGVYRTLRALERQGLVRSVWRPSAAGPARRTYSLTVEGVSALDAVTHEVRDTRRTLDAYLDRYSRYGARRAVRG